MKLRNVDLTLKIKNVRLVTREHRVNINIEWPNNMQVSHDYLNSENYTKHFPTIQEASKFKPFKQCQTSVTNIPLQVSQLGTTRQIPTTAPSVCKQSEPTSHTRAFKHAVSELDSTQTLPRKQSDSHTHTTRGITGQQLTAPTLTPVTTLGPSASTPIPKTEENHTSKLIEEAHEVRDLNKLLFEENLQLQAELGDFRRRLRSLRMEGDIGEDNVLTIQEANDLAFLIENDTRKCALNNYNLSHLINAGSKQTKQTQNDIYDILFTKHAKTHKNLNIMVKLNNTDTIHAILDSGSAENILDISVTQDLTLHTTNLPTFTTANGEPLTVLGKTSLLLTIGKLEFMTEFYVVHNLATKMILGNRFLSTNNCILDYNKEIMTFTTNGKSINVPMDKQWILNLKKTRILMALQTDPEDIPLKTIQEITIGPKQHFKYMLLSEEQQNMDFQINNDLRESKRLNVYISTINENNESKCYLNIFNSSNVNKWLKKDTLLGIFKNAAGNLKNTPPQDNESKITIQKQPINTNHEQSSRKTVNKAETKIRVIDKNGDELNINPNLTVSQHNLLANMLNKYIDCFTNRTEDLTVANVPPVRLRVQENSTPFFIPPYRQSTPERRILDNEINKLLAAGVLKESKGYTEFASPMFVATNSDGSKRVLSDLRKLNQILVKDNHPMPSCDLVFNCLARNKWYSRIDLKNAFFQIPVHENDQHYLTVSTQTNKYCWTRLPQGCAVSSTIFQRQITKILSKYLYDILIPYIDDIATGAKTFEEMLRNLELILIELQKFNLKINTSKTLLMYEELQLLGHVINSHGTKPLQTSIQAILNLRKPTKIKELRSFLGAANFFRKNVPNFAKITLPLTEAIKKYNKEKIFEFTEECNSAFKQIKYLLTNPPLLAHFHENRVTNVYCDSSDFAIGGVITQIDDKGSEVPIQYISRKLKPSERNWSVSEKEFLALTYIITRFREYTFGRKINVYTDHYSLKFYKNFKTTSVRLTRLAMLLTDYDLEINYNPGKQHHLPDLLSRNSATKQVIEDDLITVNALHEVNLKELQSEDDKLRPIIQAIRSPTTADKKYSNIAQNYKIQNGVLYKKIQKGLTEKYVIALPKSLHKTVLEEFHDSKMTGAHLNAFKVLQNLRDRFHWQGMRADTENHVRTCDDCQKRKYVTNKPYGLFQGILPTNKVLERLEMDIIGQ